MYEMPVESKSFFRKLTDSIVGIFPKRLPVKRTRNASHDDTLPLIKSSKSSSELNSDYREIKKARFHYESPLLPNIQKSIKINESSQTLMAKPSLMPRKLGYFQKNVINAVSRGTDTDDISTVMDDTGLLDFRFRAAKTVHDDLNNSVIEEKTTKVKKFVFKSILTKAEDAEECTIKKRNFRLWRCNTCFKVNRDCDSICRGCFNLSSFNEDHLILIGTPELTAQNFEPNNENAVFEPSTSTTTTLLPVDSCSISGIKSGINPEMPTISPIPFGTSLNEKSIFEGLSVPLTDVPSVSLGLPSQCNGSLTAQSIPFGLPSKFPEVSTAPVSVPQLSFGSIPFGLPSVPLSMKVVSPFTSSEVSDVTQSAFGTPFNAQSIQFGLPSKSIGVPPVSVGAPIMAFGIPSAVALPPSSSAQFTFGASSIASPAAFGAPASQSAFNFESTKNTTLSSDTHLAQQSNQIPSFSTSLNTNFTFGSNPNTAFGGANPFSGSSSVPVSMDRMGAPRRMAHRRRVAKK